MFLLVLANLLRIYIYIYIFPWRSSSPAALAVNPLLASVGRILHSSPVALLGQSLSPFLGFLWSESRVACSGRVLPYPVPRAWSCSDYAPFEPRWNGIGHVRPLPCSVGVKVQPTESAGRAPPARDEAR